MKDDYLENPGVRIYTAKLAKRILKLKLSTIIDIKPMKDNPDRSLFIFERNDKLKNYLDSLNM
jgi:hypothetical protein